MHDEDLREEFAAWLRPVREAEPPELPVIRRRLRRRRTRLAIGGSAALAAAAGIAVAVSTTLGTPGAPAGPADPAGSPGLPSNIPVTTSGPHQIRGGYQVTSVYTISSPVSALQVNEATGSITVTGSQRSTISVTERVTFHGSTPTMVRNLTGKTVTLQEGECSGEPLCVVTYEIQVPRGLAVDVQSEGNIRLSSLAGSVAALAGTGTITADGLSSREAGFTDLSGNIDATFTAPPTMVHASGSGGDVTVRVPGTVSYRVEIPTWSGGTTAIRVRQSSRSGHVIVAGSNQGAVVVTPSP
jgi:hypothetical protein